MRAKDRNERIVQSPETHRRLHDYCLQAILKLYCYLLYGAKMESQSELLMVDREKDTESITFKSDEAIIA